MPIDEPLVGSVQYVLNDSADAARIEKDVYAIIDNGLANVTSITERVIKGELKTF